MIHIHNSLTGEKEELRPIEPGALRMYVCGLTVYDYVHVGHARMLLVFDMVSRYLRHRGFRLNYVRNITDIDDKIIRRAAENHEPVEALSQRFIDAMHEDCERLGILPPDHEPRATHYLPQIITLVEKLLAKGSAYRAVNGDVMYSVASFPGYGRLSGKRLADLRAGARVADVHVVVHREPADVHAQCPGHDRPELAPLLKAMPPGKARERLARFA